jgi:hypothetical protein
MDTPSQHVLWGGHACYVTPVPCTYASSLSSGKTFMQLHDQVELS